MKLKIFYDRPVLSIVISVVIVLLGGLSLKSLPVEQYPDIAPPTINVMAMYPGANAETILKSVIVPLEESINGVEDMMYMTSTASNAGDASINIYFKQGTNADMAAVNVQNRVSTALAEVPSEVTQIGVLTMKQQNAELNTIALYSPDDRFDSKFIDNYAKINIEPRLKRIGGIGNVSNFCAQYSMRIWMDPGKMAQYGLIPSDIEAVLANQNIEAATGQFGENYGGQFQYSMKYRGRKILPEEFENLVVKSLPGGDVLRLKDVARVELGSEAYNFQSFVNGHAASIITCYQSAGSNASATIEEIDAVLDEVRKGLPEGLEIVKLTDTNRFLYASIAEVVKSLLLAILLVVLVVYVFLQDVRSTLIPTLAIFVSIIGTFACMSLLGFSINLLTLFALVLAIGTVVDNAIVVVEAVQARFDQGYRSSYLATHDAMGGISAAILVSTLIFMAVFIPVSMIGGTSGFFYKQFGLTMAVAVGISAINAFTLSPALCALMLQPYVDENGQQKDNFAARFRKAFTAVFDTMSKHYLHGVMFFMKRRWLVWSTLAVGIALLLVSVKMTKTGFVPQEDTGTMMVEMTTPPGTSLRSTNQLTSRVWEEIQKMPEIEYVGGITGFSFSGSGPSQGMTFLSLKDWNERPGSEHSAEAVMERMQAIFPQTPDLSCFAALPPMIPGYGMSGGLELYLQDRKGGDIEEFKAVRDKFVDALSQRKEMAEVFSAFETTYPQYWVDIDAAKCEQCGISTGEVLQTLSTYFGGCYASSFNRFNKLYRVLLQAEPDSRITPESLENFYVRVASSDGSSVPFSAASSSGGMAPLSHFVTLTKTYGPSNLTRFNLYNSISVSATPAVGYSSGDAIRAVSEVARETLPPGYGYEFGGMTREEAQTSGNVALIFVLCIALTYLILCALYESLFLPFAIILAVPCGLAGSFLATWALGLENNIYLQTGVIMLIGLLAKTAILLTDYAQQNRRRGLSLTMSAFTAARVRLRPILMTALTMVFGLLPMLVASGVGANGSRSLATGAVGGMILGTLVLLFLVPVLFIIFQWMDEKFTFLKPKKPAGSIAAIFLVMVTLSGCGAYKACPPDFLRTSTTKDDENAVISENEKSVILNDSEEPIVKWQEFFPDTLLQQHIRIALENNADLATARQKVIQAEAVLGAARLAYLPSLNIGVETGLTQCGKISVVPAANWEIDIFGKLTAEKRSAFESAEAARDYQQAAQTQLVTSVASTYYALIVQDRQLELLHQTLGLWQEMERTFESLKRAGRANDAALLQAHAATLQLQGEIVPLQRQIVSINHAFCSLLGIPIQEVTRATAEGESLGQSLDLQIGTIMRRPDVREAEHRLAAAYYTDRAALAAFYPSISISGNAAFSFNPTEIVGNILGSLMQPLFNRGQLQANKTITAAQQEEAAIAFRQTLLVAAQEIADAQVSLKASTERIEIDNERIATLEEAVRKTELLMRHSGGSYLEVLTARSDLLTARQTLLEDQLAQAQAIIALYHALGGGCK